MDMNPNHEELRQRINKKETRILTSDQINEKIEKVVDFSSDMIGSVKNAILEGIKTNLAFVNKDLEILWANKSTSGSVNRSKDKIIGQKCHELWADLKAPCDGCPTVKAFKTGKTEQAIIHFPDGKVWDEKGEPIFNEKDEIIGVLEIAYDVTDKARAEEAMKESESKFRNLFDLSPQAIAITEIKTGKLVEANDKFCELTQYSSEEIIGRTTTEIGFYSEESRKKFINELMKSGEVRGLEMNYRIKDGSILTMLVFSRAIQTSDEPFIFTILLDITEQKQLEIQLQQSKKMEAIGTLAGGIAHDFNNILGIILGNTELAIDDTPGWNPSRNNLDEIRTACFRAKDIVRQILSFSHKSEQRLSTIKLDSVVKESIKLIRSSIPTTIEINQDIPRNISPVRADLTQINQILLNLCINARHAMGDEGGILKISLENTTQGQDDLIGIKDLGPGNYVKLTVRDNGCGMSSELQKRIFEPYFTTKEIGEGNGMGLAVVHGIIKNCGGHISVISKPNVGSIFQIFFPAVKEEVKPSTHAHEAIPKGDGEHILVVDDERAVADLIKMTLENLGYRVEAKTNPVEALELFISKPDFFDLVITDMTMPGMTGDKLVEELKRIRPRIPIIICTGYGEHNFGKKLERLGISAFMMKPASAHKIGKTVHEVVNREKQEVPHVSTRILVVDDEEKMRLLLRQMLENAGYEVEEAPDGKVALWLQKEKPVDLIITDIIMPGTEGLETIAELKRDFPDVKIIAISGGGKNDPETYLSIAKVLGVKRTFQKPFEKKDILKAVRELVG